MRTFRIYSGSSGDPRVLHADEVKIKAHGAFFWKITDTREYEETHMMSGMITRHVSGGSLSRVLVLYIQSSQYIKITEVERVQDER
jgi:hypothetical protein